jgi:serine/threonine-protein kinase
MGEVFLAEDTMLGRNVALKFLPASMWNEAEAQQRLIREAKSASQLDHPNIVTIHGIEQHDGRPYIVMAHVRGVTLNEYCTSKPRTTDELVDLAIQIADGLEHAHEHGVVHRDLKPGNILVDERGRVRILDFGIARLRGTTRLTQVGSTIGTLAYSPPELAQGKDAEPTSDIYSLGVVMYQMLTGRLPFDADHEAALLYSILHEPPLAFTGSNANVPVKLQSVILKCLEKQPEKRFASCIELMAELKRCKSMTTSSDAATSVVSKPSIAVLPFANMSNDPENEYFSDGLSEELLNVLAKNTGLKVTGRTSSFAFKGKHEDLREIGQKLGVGTLLEGSVRKAGNRVRITTQLVNVADGFHLWSETYDRVLDDIFAVQDDIAKAVATAMNVTLLGKSEAKSSVNPEIYNLLLQAKYFAARIERESLEKALALYQRILAAEPGNAKAWAGLAQVTATQSGYGLSADRADVMPTAVAAAQKAVELDDTLADAHATRGWLYMAYEFKWMHAGESFRRAYALAPGNAEVITGLAAYESYCGDVDEGVRLSEKAVALDPLDPSTHIYAAKSYAAARKLEKALDTYGTVLALAPETTSAHAACSYLLSTMGRLEEALEEAKKEPHAGYRNFSLAIAFHGLGRKAESEAALVQLSSDERWAFQIASVHAMRGELDQAFMWLDKSYELNDSGLTLTWRHPLLTNLHTDPRWPALLKKIGLAN